MASRQRNSKKTEVKSRNVGLGSIGPDQLNALLGKRDDAGIVSEMTKSGGIGRVVPYRNRWRIDLGRAMERAVGVRYIYGFGKGAPFDTKGAADVILMRLNTDIGTGGRTPEEAVLAFLPPGKNSLVLARMAKWLDRLHEQVESGDLSDNYVRDIDRWLGDGPAAYFQWWDGKSLYDLDEETVEDFGRWLAQQKAKGGRSKGKNLKGKTRQNIMAALHSFLTWASRRDKRVRPLDWYPWPAVDEPDIQVISVEERDAIIAAIPERKRGVYLGLRLGAPRPGMAVEVLASDYDRKARMLTLARARKGRRASSKIGSTKNRSGWTIPVDADLAAWIEKWVPKSAILQGRLLFENPDAYNPRKAWTETRLRDTWYKACDKAIGRRVPPYASTKHTFATNVIAAGGSEFDLQEYLNHKDSRSTRRYVRAAKQRFASIQRFGLVGKSQETGEESEKDGTGGD